LDSAASNKFSDGSINNDLRIDEDFVFDSRINQKKLTNAVLMRLNIISKQNKGKEIQMDKEKFAVFATFIFIMYVGIAMIAFHHVDEYLNSSAGLSNYHLWLDNYEKACGVKMNMYRAP
jgi:hypothetical protein